MECFSPIKIRLPTGELQQVSCGHCFACQSNRRKDWYFRLKTEMKYSLCSYTVTLTYDDDNLPPLVPYYEKDSQGFPIENIETHEKRISFWYNPISVEDVQSYHHRLRKFYKFRYFAVLEYGGKTNRPHAHIIYFFDYPCDYDEFSRRVLRVWQKGHRLKVDHTDDRCINYTSKYLFKPYQYEQPRPKMLCSKRPFIGHQHLNHDIENKLNYYLSNSTDMSKEFGNSQRLPRIYRDKLFPDLKDFFTEVHMQGLENQLRELVQRADELGTTPEKLKENARNHFKRRVLQQLKEKQI